MRLKSFCLVIAVMLFAFAATVSAQTPRTLGARRLLLDDGTNTGINGQNYITEVSGSLAVDNIGALPSVCALLDLQSVTKGFLVPRMSFAQMNAICPGTTPEGLIVYDLTNHTLDVFNGSAWGPIQGWTLRGNVIASGGTALGSSYIGTNNAQDYVIATNGVERGRYIGVAGATQGFLGVGTPTPNRQLEVAGVSGTPSARFGSLSGAPLVAPPLVATDGFVIANNNGDISKYGGAVAVGSFGWLRTGNTILDGNNILGTLNDVAINVTQNSATVMTVGTVAQGSNIGIKTAPGANWPLTVGAGAGSNSTLNLGNEQVNGTFTSAGNSTVGTNAGTTNTFGNNGAATNNIGNGAGAANNMGNGGGATVNSIGNFATTNFFGQSVTGSNNVGRQANSNNFGFQATTNIFGDQATTNTFGVAATTNTIGATGTSANSMNGNTNSILGTTLNAITLDVNNTANNLTINNILNGSNTDIGFLSLGAAGINANSGPARLRSIGSIITGSQGVQVEYTGSSADAHFAKDNTSVLFSSTRFINTNNQILNITSGNPGANNVIQVNGATNAVNVNTGNYGLTQVGNGANPANTQLQVNGALGGLVGVAPYSNGPNNGWASYNSGNAQVAGVFKAGTASIVVDGSVTGLNNIISGWTNNLTLQQGTAGKDIVLQTTGGVVATAKSAGNLDIPVTAAGLGLGTISQNGARFIHSFGGASNFFAGTGAGNYTMTGTSNTAIGQSSQQATTFGFQNTSVGTASLTNVTSGFANTAVGYIALISDNTGVFNSAFGGGALQNTTTGSDNTSSGVNSLQLNSTGSNNVAMGFQALINTTNNNNTAIGTSAGLTNTTGLNNTFLGNGADANAAGYSFATAVGSNAIVGANSSVILGRVGDNVGIGIIAPTTNLDVRGSTTVVGLTNINSNNASVSATNIGSTTNTSAVTIASNSAAASGAIVLDVTNVANTLEFNNVATGVNTDAAFLDISAVPSGRVRTRTIQSMVTGSSGVSVEYPGTSVADAHFADANNKSIFATPRFINEDNQLLSFTGGGANTTFITFDGNTNNVGINDLTVGNNRIGNGGGTTTNAFGNTAFNNQFGNNATSNNFGNAVTGNNQFGDGSPANDFGVANSAVNVTNAIGTNSAAGSATNNIGNRAGAGAVTTNIGTIGAVNNNIGSAATTLNKIEGTTNLNNNINSLTQINTGTSTGNVFVGNGTAGSGVIDIMSNRGGNGNSIILDVTAAATNNLELLNIANDPTPLNMLSLNAASQVRTTALSLMALEGLAYSGGAFRLGSNLGGGDPVNAIITNRTVTITAPGSLAFVNSGGNMINISNGGTNTLTLGNLGGTNIMNGFINNINGTTNINIGAFALTTIGNGTAVRQLLVNGVQDATGAEAFASPVWDLAVKGDIAATGMIKSGASLVLDGFSGNRRLISDAALTISTDLAGAGTGGILTLSTSAAGNGINMTTTGNNANIAIGPTGLGNGSVAINSAGTGTISVSTTGSGDITVGSSAGGNVNVINNGTSNGLKITSSGNVSLQNASAGGIDIFTTTTGPIQLRTTTSNIIRVGAVGDQVVVGSLTNPTATLDVRGSMAMPIRSIGPGAPGPVNGTDYTLLYTDNSVGADQVLALPVGTQGRVIVVKNLSTAGNRRVAVTPPAGIQIDNGGAGVAYVISAGGNLSRVFQYDGISGQWYVIGN